MSEETKSPIVSLVIDYNQRVRAWQPCVGVNGVTKIVRADENGEMAMVPWFAIYVGEEIAWKVNGKYVVEVSYGN